MVAVLRVGSDGSAAMQPDIRRHASGRCIVNDSDGSAAMQPDIRWHASGRCIVSGQ